MHPAHALHFDVPIDVLADTAFVPPRAETPQTGQKLPSTLDKAFLAKRVAFALQAWGCEKSAAIKRVRKIAGVDRKTAASWWHGKSPPQSDHLFNLARRIPELKAEVRRLLELEHDLHEDLTREIAALVRRAMKR